MAEAEGISHPGALIDNCDERLRWTLTIWTTTPLPGDTETIVAILGTRRWAEAELPVRFLARFPRVCKQTHR